MPGTKCIIFAFGHPRKPADAFVHPVGMKNILPACKDLMCISLVADIPDDLIERSIEYIMDSNGKFNRTQAGTQVSGICGDHINDELPDLCAEPGNIFNFQLPKVRRVIYSC